MKGLLKQYRKGVSREQLREGRFMRYLKDDMRHVIRVREKASGRVRYRTFRYGDTYYLEAEWMS